MKERIVQICFLTIYIDYSISTLTGYAHLKFAFKVRKAF